MLPDQEELERMREVDIREADPSSFTDIRDITIDKSKSASERMEQYLEQVKNPYLIRVGKFDIKLSFCESGGTLADRMKRYIQRRAELDLFPEWEPNQSQAPE